MDVWLVYRIGSDHLGICYIAVGVYNTNEFF